MKFCKIDKDSSLRGESQIRRSNPKKSIRTKCESLLKFLLHLAFTKRKIPLNFTNSNPPKKVDSQNLVQNNRAQSAHLESRPLRGAKNREQGRSSASADFLLEAEKRGTLPKSEKRSFWRVGGAGWGVQPFLRKEKDSKENAESIKNQFVDCHADSANLLTMTNLEFLQIN